MDPATVTADAFYLQVAGRRIPGQIRVDPDGRSISFLPDEILPASTTARLVVDGDLILDLAGTPIDANGDGVAGGVGQFDFSTVGLTRIAVSYTHLTLPTILLV